MIWQIYYPRLGFTFGYVESDGPPVLPNPERMASAPLPGWVFNKDGVPVPGPKENGA